MQGLQHQRQRAWGQGRVGSSSGCSARTPQHARHTHSEAAGRTTMSMMKLLLILYNQATSMDCEKPTSAVDTAMLHRQTVCGGRTSLERGVKRSVAANCCSSQRLPNHTPLTSARMPT
jgi:hypothetical protein